MKNTMRDAIHDTEHSKRSQLHFDLLKTSFSCHSIWTVQADEKKTDKFTGNNVGQARILKDFYDSDVVNRLIAAKKKQNI